LYDAKGHTKEFVAETRQDALAEAVSFFGKEETDLKVLELGMSEVAGLGNRCLLIVEPKGVASQAGGEPARAPKPERERKPRAEERKPRESERKAREVTPKPVEVMEFEAQKDEEGVSVVSSELGRFVEGLVQRMAIGAFSIDESEDADLNVVTIRGEAARDLTAGNGRAVDAIQFLVNQAALRGEENRRVVLEVEGDPEQREAYLTKLADRAARRAQDAERAMALDPMNPKDRRIVHVALRDYEGVATMSVGSGRYRRVVVVPEGSPEYEEAMRENRLGGRNNNG